jgi:hypothetical protein
MTKYFSKTVNHIAVKVIYHGNRRRKKAQLYDLFYLFIATSYKYTFRFSDMSMCSNFWSVDCAASLKLLMQYTSWLTAELLISHSLKRSSIGSPTCNQKGGGPSSSKTLNTKKHILLMIKRRIVCSYAKEGILF